MAKRNATITAAWIGAVALILAALITVYFSFPMDRNTQTGTEISTQDPVSTFESFVLDSRYFPSGWMGDGKFGEKYVNVEHESSNVNGQSKMAIKFQYASGPEGWAGVYWQYPDGNWGSQPGLNLEGANEIVFFARGADGGELVEFKSGGISGHYSDSFEKSLGQVALTKEWQLYRIELENESLASVIGAFAWVAPVKKGQTMAFWLAEVQVR